MVEVLERGAALAEAASRTAGRRKRDMLGGGGGEIWAEGGGCNWDAALDRKEKARERKKKRPTTTDGAHDFGRATDWAGLSSWSWSLMFGRGSRFRNTPAKRQEISGAPAAAQRSKNSLDVEPSSVEMAESPISVGRPAAPSWEHRPTKASVGLSPGPASSPNG